MSQLELRGGLLTAKTDSSSTERAHSKNERRARFRVWTHTQDLASLSAWFSTGTVCVPSAFEVHAETVEGAGPESARAAASSSSAPAPARARRQVPSSWWTWRAFQHMEGGGTFCTREFGAELSERCRGRSIGKRVVVGALFQHWFWFE